MSVPMPDLRGSMVSVEGLNAQRRRGELLAIGILFIIAAVVVAGLALA